MPHIVADQLARHAQLHVGIDELVVLGVDLREQRLEPSLVARKCSAQGECLMCSSNTVCRAMARSKSKLSVMWRPRRARVSAASISADVRFWPKADMASVGEQRLTTRDFEPDQAVA